MFSKKRGDGYHELMTVMQTVDLYDTICMIEISVDDVEIVCSLPELNAADNLVVKAAQAIRKELSLKRGVRIELQKRIPIAAGLGGGSGNAAAVLIGLQKWWQLPLSYNRLLGIPASLGSDVPFFPKGGLALCVGRGEEVRPLPPKWPSALRWIVLLKPEVSIFAFAVYRDLSPRDYTTGGNSEDVCSALMKKENPNLTGIQNSLERGIVANYPLVRQAKEDFAQAGAINVFLSGSGPSFFAFFATFESAFRVQQILHRKGHEVYITDPTNDEEIEFF
jgi:4-diphosphocytidyl-2-C-methyl-D-erythritol kinase